MSHNLHFSLRPYMLAVALVAVVSAVAQTALTDYVEPRVGTAHCRWFHFAPGAMPFGMAKPGPSTNGHLGNKWGWEATGYDYRDTTIDGFPCLHEFQVGGIVLMPTRGELHTVPGDSLHPTGYRSAFSHDREVVKPGYYAVDLDTYGIRAEATATMHTAYLRFTYPEDTTSRILFDIGHRQGESGTVVDASVWLTPEGRIEGWVVTEPEYVKKYQPGADIRMYFSATVDKQPQRWGTFIDDCVQQGQRQVRGAGAGLYIEFATRPGEPVTACVGLSYTSVENARLNRESEAARPDFDATRAAAHQSWEEALGRIRVETPVHSDKVKFYTGLYHALLGRGVASDVRGTYPRHDGTVGQISLGADGKPRHQYYNTDALWGAQWNLNQLWMLAWPEHVADFISSQLLIYQDSGWLADGVACGRYVSGVGTNQVSLLMAAAYACGIRDFDVQTAYEACLKNELDGNNRPFGAGKSDTRKFVEYGYAPFVESGEGADETFMFSASHTLEYSFSAWAVAQWAKALGRKDDYRRLMHLASGWERLYDSATGFIRPRLADGRFLTPFDPMEVWRGFQEGNAWQYTFYVPHQADRLAKLVGRDRLCQRLDSIFTVSEKLIFSGGTTVDAFAGLQTLYNHGNQPCLHISWLMAEAGRPDLTQHWVRAICNQFYGTDGLHGYGYGQDEDQGQLGAWYVISSIGLFDVAGLTGSRPSVALGQSLFPRVTIQLNPRYAKGRTLTIECQSDSDAVTSYTIDGRKISGHRIPFARLMQGGTIVEK